MRIRMLLLASMLVFGIAAGDLPAAENGHWEVTSAPGIYNGTPTDFNCLGTDGTCWTRYKWVADAGQVRQGVFLPSEGVGYVDADVVTVTDDDGETHESIEGDLSLQVYSEDELMEILSSE